MIDADDILGLVASEQRSRDKLIAARLSWILNDSGESPDGQLALVETLMLELESGAIKP